MAYTVMAYIVMAYVVVASNSQCLVVGAEECLRDVRPASQPITIALPDGTVSRSTHTGLLPFDFLPLGARQCHLVPNFKGSLISIGTLTDHGLVATFDDTQVVIVDGRSGDTVLRGTRGSDRLYYIDLDFAAASSHTAVSPTSSHDPPITQPFAAAATTTSASGLTSSTKT